MTLNRTVPTLTSYHQFSSTNTELSNASIVDNINVDFGVFGRHILSEYCGSTITTKFYSPSHNIDTNLLDTEDVDIYGMLLTEEQMGRIALENIVLFIAFTFLSITIQTIFALYFKSCKTGCDNYYLQREIANETNGDQSLEEKTKCCESFVDSQTARNTDRCSKCCMGILALLVLVHLCVSMHEYYTFVDHEVQYDDLLTNYSYMGHEYKYALESCNDDGIGLISCPALFCDHDDNGHCLRITNEEGYDIEEAQHICSWVFYMLIIANPTVFQYTVSLYCFSRYNCILINIVYDQHLSRYLLHMFFMVSLYVWLLYTLSFVCSSTKKLLPRKYLLPLSRCKLLLLLLRALWSILDVFKLCVHFYFNGYFIVLCRCIIYHCCSYGFLYFPYLCVYCIITIMSYNGM
eukprot:164048_1